MGCDIHVVLEKKWNDKWVGLKEYGAVCGSIFNPESREWSKGYIFFKTTTRNYDRFAKLAGVRGEGPDPKGLPADASDLSLMLYGGDNIGLHSHSWHSLREAAQIFLASEGDPAELFLLDKPDPRRDDPFGHYFDVELYDDESPDDYRIVYCFDN